MVVNVGSVCSGIDCRMRCRRGRRGDGIDGRMRRSRRDRRRGGSAMEGTVRAVK